MARQFRGNVPEFALFPHPRCRGADEDQKKAPRIRGRSLLYFGSSFRNFLEEIDHVRTLDLRCANHHLERPIEQSLLDVSTLDQAASRI